MPYVTGEETKAAVPAQAAPPGIGARILDSDLWYSFRRSPVTIVSAIITLGLILVALFAPLIAPQDPFDPANISIMDSF